MPTNVSEMNLEDMILAYLRDKQGYEEGTTNDYVKDHALGRKNLGGEIDSTSPSSALPLRRDLSYLSTLLYLVARALPCEAISGVLQRPSMRLRTCFCVRMPLNAETKTLMEASLLRRIT